MLEGQEARQLKGSKLKGQSTKLEAESSRAQKEKMRSFQLSVF